MQELNHLGPYRQVIIFNERNERVPWMAKVLCGTIDANNEPLFLNKGVCRAEFRSITDVKRIF